MPTTIVEENLRFQFDEFWWSVKYDGHPDQQRIERLNNTKSVDIIAVHEPTDVLYFIDVKDFRGHRIENWKRMRDGELTVEVAQKVRDTISGIVAAYHRGSLHDWKRVITRLTSRTPPVRVLFWLEQDVYLEPRSRKENQASLLENALTRQLKWLTPKVLVTSLVLNRTPSGLVVENLPGAAQST